MKTEFINIGNFNEAIIFKAPTVTTASSGQVIRSFATYRTMYAEVIPGTLNESEISNRVQNSETYTFTTYYDAAVNSKYQLVYNGENYNLLHTPTPLNLKRFMRVTATKIVS